MPRSPNSEKISPKEHTALELYLTPGTPAYNNRTEAYIRAGFKCGKARKSAMNQASLFFQLPKCQIYIAKVRAGATERAEITRESLSDMLLDDRMLAYAKESPSAAVSASSALMKLHGWDVHKHEFTGKDGAPILTEDLSGLSEKERDQRLAAIMRKAAIGAKAES